jgi:hypothetical protein
MLHGDLPWHMKSWASQALPFKSVIRQLKQWQLEVKKSQLKKCEIGFCVPIVGANYSWVEHVP